MTSDDLKLKPGDRVLVECEVFEWTAFVERDTDEFAMLDDLPDTTGLRALRIHSVLPRPISAGDDAMHVNQRVHVVFVRDGEAWIEWQTAPSPTLGIVTRQSDIVPLSTLTRVESSDE